MTRERHRRPRPSKPGDYPRTWRVNEVLRQVVAEELERLADADERLRMLTVTAVDTSNDLRRATVFLGSIGPDAAEALDERRSQLQAEVGQQVRMKRTPRLEFTADPAVATGARVDEILRRLHERRPVTEPAEPSTGSEPPAAPPGGTPAAPPGGPPAPERSEGT